MEYRRLMKGLLLIMFHRCQDDSVSERARTQIFEVFVEKKKSQRKDKMEEEDDKDDEDELEWFLKVEVEVIQRMIFDIASAPTTKER